MTELPHGIARVAMEMMLDEIELKLVLDPDANEARFDRGCLLEALGRADEAKRCYREVLRADPAHFGAWNNLGVLLFRQGFWRSAGLAYARAVAQHPSNAIGHAHLATVLHIQGRQSRAVGHYETALELDPSDAKAHHGLAHVFIERGDESAGIEHQRAGMRSRPVTISEYRGSKEPVRVLVVGSAGEGNIPADRYFDPNVFSRASLIAEFFDQSQELPPHHVVFNVVGDADRCAPALVAASAILLRTQAPILNPPSNVLVTGRAANSQRLGSLTGVLAAKMATFSRNLLGRGEAAVEMLGARGFAWPLLLRTPGYHTGQHFVKVDRPGDLAAAVQSLPGDTLMAIEYLDARGADGKFRKYRVMMIDGRLYPLHLAISNDWKVHYFSADMAENAANRTEDERFLRDMRGVLGPEVIASLERIRDALGLDYAGVDFAVGLDGRTLLFEANATMIVPDPPPEPQWTYRRHPVTRIVNAVRSMLVDRARLGGYNAREQGAGRALEER